MVLEIRTSIPMSVECYEIAVKRKKKKGGGKKKRNANIL